MTRLASTTLRALLPALVALAALPCAGVEPGEFAWRAPLTLPSGAVAARLTLPADALAQLRSRELADLRVFNAADEPVAFSLTAPQAATAAATLTPDYAAHALMRSGGTARPSKSSVQVRIAQPGSGTVWVDLRGDGADTAPDQRLPAGLFDTRGEKQLLQSITVQGELPANAPVRLSASASSDLAQWSPLSLRGSLYRFDGPEGMANMTLAFDVPQRLEGRYLQLDWGGQAGVAVRSVRFTVAGQAQRQRVALALPQGTAVNGGLEWALDFATPVSALALATPQANSLVPVRVLGRSEPSQPWRALAQAAVWRLGAAGSESVNPPLPLAGQAVRRLRVEPSQGLPLPPALVAAVEFEPVQLAFLATGQGPFTLAAGRDQTPAAQLAAGMLAAALPGPVDALPLAVVGTAQLRPAEAPSAVAALLPRDLAPKTALLWAVLGVGVLLLGAVAWRLMRQLKAEPPAA